MTTHLLYLHVYECNEWMKIFEIRSYWLLEGSKFYQIDIEFVDRHNSADIQKLLHTNILSGLNMFHM